MKLEIIMKKDLSYTIKETMEQRFDEVNSHLMEIKAQTVKTNGRVGSLESHRAYLWGAYTVLTLLGALIIHQSVTAIDHKIQAGIREALSGYNIEVR